MRVSGNSTMTDVQSKAFGAEMRRLRKEAKLTTTEFGKYVGVTATYISQLERAMRKPSPQLAERIAGAFDLTVEDMLKPYSEREREARERYGKALMKRRTEKGFSMSLVAGALGIPVAVYKEYEQGLCSITERNMATLAALLGDDKKAEAEEPKSADIKVDEAVEDEVVESVGGDVNAVPTEICDIILGHITDLKVDKDTQKKVWHYFTSVKIDAEERRLFG